MKLLSVIIPVYNVEQYLERCVLSVVYQTYHNLEILLIDDGSQDQSGKICDQLSQKYKRIRVIHKKNEGLSDARNKGLDLAKGEYITFLDSDDYIHPETYSILISQLETANADIVEGKILKVYSNPPLIRKIETAQIIQMNRDEAMLSSYDWKYFTAIVCNKIYKRNIVENKQFPVGKYHEDEFFCHETLYRAQKLIHVNAEFYYYQQRPNSIRSSEFNIRHVDAIEAFKNRLEFFKGKNDVLYTRGCLRIVEYTLEKMQYLTTTNHATWKQRKPLYYACGRAFQSLDKEIVQVYEDTRKNSKHKLFEVKLLRFSPFLFHYIYLIYKKYGKK